MKKKNVMKKRIPCLKIKYFEQRSDEKKYVATFAMNKTKIKKRRIKAIQKQMIEN